jgi:hypothetical protein
MRKRDSAFFGDSGTMLPEQARDEIEQNAGAGHKGNNVDFSQRYAQSEADEYTEQAERMTRDMERNAGFGIPADPEKRRPFVDQFAELLRNPNGNGQKQVQPQEPKEEGFLSRAADEKFWSDPEEMKRAGKMVRPAKL